MYPKEFEDVYSQQIYQTKMDKEISYGVWLVVKHRQTFSAYKQQRDLDLAIDNLSQGRLL